MRELLDQAKAASDDQDTATSVVLILACGHVITASNTLPAGVARSHERTSRPSKYHWIEHSERNALYAAARVGKATEGSTMYMDWFPCADCARAIVQAGVRVLYCGPLPSDDGRYGFSAAASILAEGGVLIKGFIPSTQVQHRYENSLPDGKRICDSCT